MTKFNLISIYDDQRDIPYSIWPKCTVHGCSNRSCLSLNSKKCYPHTIGENTKAKEMINDINVNKLKIWNKCDICGKFIAYENFHNGKAKSVMITPDSELTKETFETLCPEHYEHYKGE